MHIAEARRYSRWKPRSSRVRTDDYFAFEGGLNLVDTPLKVAPGELLGGKNYEPGIRGGYARLQGFERLDGRTKPSAASFTYMDLTATTPANYPTVGQTVTGGTSGATGRVLVAVTDDPGVVVGRVVGVFVDGETLTGPGGAFGVVLEDPLVDLAPTDDQVLEFKGAAADDLRTLIQAVPGEDAILGVCPFNTVTYAFRNKVGGATAGMYKSTSGGWVEVVPNSTLAFDGAVGTEPAEGATVTGLSSGATGVIKRVVNPTGAIWVGTSGYFVLSTITGTFTNNEELRVSGVKVADANGTQSATTLLPDGRYEFRIHNFRGHTETRRLYGTDGVNKAFEYDDIAGVFTQISTGMVVDKPTHLAVHQHALWLSFPGGSVQQSSDAEPLEWSVITGAAEIAVGAEVTGFLEEVGDVMFIMTEKRSYFLSGRRDNWIFDEYNFETGSLAWTIQRIGQGIYLDQRAFASLAASDKYGNFAYDAFSDKVQPVVNSLRGLATASCVSRVKNLYRCFFSDGRFISIGVRGAQVTGITLCDYGMPVRCIESLQEGPLGSEMIVFGSDDGYVYQADIGRSFDGDEIEAFARIAFHYSKSPTRRKRYRHASVDVTTSGATSLMFAVDFSFGSDEEPGNPGQAVDVAGGGGFWDIDNWDEFRWSTGVVSTLSFKLEGAGRNIGLLFYHNSELEESHSIEGLVLHYTMRRIDRGSNL